MGKRLNVKNQNKQTPGPGFYEIPNKSFEEQSGGYIRKKSESKKKSFDSENFYKYNPKEETVKYRSPQYSFFQSSTTANIKYSDVGPTSYRNEKKSSSEFYSMGKSQRFKPFSKQSIQDCLDQKDNYSTIGKMPNYLKKKSIVGV